MLFSSTLAKHSPIELLSKAFCDPLSLRAIYRLLTLAKWRAVRDCLLEGQRKGKGILAAKAREPRPCGSLLRDLRRVVAC